MSQPLPHPLPVTSWLDHLTIKQRILLEAVLLVYDRASEALDSAVSARA